MTGQRVKTRERRYISATTTRLTELARRVVGDSESLTAEEVQECQLAADSLWQVLEAKGLTPNEVVKLVLGPVLRPHNSHCDCLICRSRLNNS